VYLVEGAHEAPGHAVLAREWFASLSAPDKQLIEFDRSATRPSWMSPDASPGSWPTSS
jgi:proline iminopeptidase